MFRLTQVKQPKFFYKSIFNYFIDNLFSVILFLSTFRQFKSKYKINWTLNSNVEPIPKKNQFTSNSSEFSTNPNPFIVRLQLGIFLLIIFIKRRMTESLNVVAATSTATTAMWSCSSHLISFPQRTMETNGQRLEPFNIDSIKLRKINRITRC